MESILLNAKMRNNLGKKESKTLRSLGKIPCVLYGGKENVHFQLEENDLKKLVYTPKVFIVELTIDSTKIKALVKDIQFHPVNDKILHVDFIELVDEKPVNTQVPIILTGNSIGVLNGGKLVKNLRKLSLRAIPKNLPDNISIDITNLKIGDKIYVRDLNYNQFEITTSENSVLVTIKTSRAAVEEEIEETDSSAESKPTDKDSTSKETDTKTDDKKRIIYE
jgi:large subunit ribosomal protein L25